MKTKDIRIIFYVSAPFLIAPLLTTLFCYAGGLFTTIKQAVLITASGYGFIAVLIFLFYISYLILNMEVKA